MAHRNAPLTPRGRLLLCRRIATGSPVAHVAAQIGISRHCATKWWLRDQELGEKGLSDRPSQPVTSPRRTPERLEEKICRIRRAERIGPDRIAWRLGIPASTVHRVLTRHDLSRLRQLDRGSPRCLVGRRGLEPLTSCVSCKRATGLRQRPRRCARYHQVVTR